MTLETERQYFDEVHRVSVHRAHGEPLGLCVKLEGDCVLVSRIIDGGLIEKTNGLIGLGDIIVEVCYTKHKISLRSQRAVCRLLR